MLQNLLANALKYRRPGTPPAIDVFALLYPRGLDHHGARDYGLGVNPDQAGQIFGMFSRGRHYIDGAGIGLAVCRRIVEAHGGRIWAEPATGGGSAFRFTLPG